MTMQIMIDGLWQWIPRVGLERFELVRDTGLWILRGTIVTQAEAGATEAMYEVRCDEDWITRSADVSIADSSGKRSVHIESSNGRWIVDGVHASQVDGCLDIDLGWSPSTNTIAIRRLNLAIGAESGPLTMAWVRFPELTLEPLPQAYARLDERLYRYMSRDGSFRADLTVDEEAMVIDYEGIWGRVRAKA
jgi:uncharacterized protein